MCHTRRIRQRDGWIMRIKKQRQCNATCTCALCLRVGSKAFGGIVHEGCVGGKTDYPAKMPSIVLWGIEVSR
jgi:hypothetical protein